MTRLITWTCGGLLASDGKRTSLQISDNQDNLPENQIPTNPSTYHCDIMAWNQAISNGQDSRGQNGEAPDLNDINVNTWFDSFPNNRSVTPVPREYDLTVDTNGSAGRGTATYVPLNNP